MAPGLRSSIRLKMFKPTVMNRAWITTVAAMSAAPKLKRKNIGFATVLGIRELHRPRSANPCAAHDRWADEDAAEPYRQQTPNHTDKDDPDRPHRRGFDAAASRPERKGKPGPRHGFPVSS